MIDMMFSGNSELNDIVLIRESARNFYCSPED